MARFLAAGRGNRTGGEDAMRFLYNGVEHYAKTRSVANSGRRAMERGESIPREHCGRV